MNRDLWTYEGYWNVVVGDTAADEAAETLAAAFDIAPAHAAWATWLAAHAEVTAWAEAEHPGAHEWDADHVEPVPAEWAAFREKAAAELCAAHLTLTAPTRRASGTNDTLAKEPTP